MLGEIYKTSSIFLLSALYYWLTLENGLVRTATCLTEIVHLYCFVSDFSLDTKTQDPSRRDPLYRFIKLMQS